MTSKELEKKLKLLEHAYNQLAKRVTYVEYQIDERLKDLEEGKT